MTNPMVIEAHTLTDVPGNAGIKIAAAIARLPVGIGGRVDATGFLHPQNLTGFTIPPGVTVELGPILYTLPANSPSVVVAQGARLLGAGTNNPGATTLRAYRSFNKDLVRCVSTAGEADWWHHGEVRGLRLDGNKAQNTSGHGLSVYGLAETSLLQRLNIHDAPQAGLYVRGSQSGTGSVENVTLNRCGVYGVQLDQFRSGITLKCVGGDHNPITVAVTGPQTGGGSILLLDPKSEGALDVPLFIAGGSAGVTLTIVGGNFLNVATTPQAAIRIDATVRVPPSIQILGLVTGNNMPILIDDRQGGHVLTTSKATLHALVAYCAGQFVRFDATGFATGAL